MKTKNLVIAAFMIMGVILISTFSSCTKPNGTVTFWTNTADGVGFVTVTINGTNTNITSDYSSTPSCSANGTATFSLAEGTYNYTAAETTTGTNGTMDTWSGSVTVTSNGCLTMNLYD